MIKILSGTTGWWITMFWVSVSSQMKQNISSNICVIITEGSTKFSRASSSTVKSFVEQNPLHKGHLLLSFLQITYSACCWCCLMIAYTCPQGKVALWSLSVHFPRFLFGHRLVNILSIRYRETKTCTMFCWSQGTHDNPSEDTFAYDSHILASNWRTLRNKETSLSRSLPCGL